MLVATPAVAPSGDPHALPRRQQLRLGPVSADDVDHGAERHAQGEVLPGGTIAVLALAIPPPLRPVDGLPVEVVERREAGVRLHVNTAASAAVSAGRPAM